MKQDNKFLLEVNAAATKRWRTRLKRAMTMLDKLERQRKRLEAVPKPKVPSAKSPSSEPEKPGAVQASLPAYPTVDSETTPGALPPQDDLTLPDFLKRGIAAQKAIDEVIADQIKAEQEAIKKAKASGRIGKMKAKQRGDLKKMPLTGKAALEMIRNG